MVDGFDYCNSIFLIHQKRTETRIFLILASKIGKHTRQGLKSKYEQMEWQNEQIRFFSNSGVFGVGNNGNYQGGGLMNKQIILTEKQAKALTSGTKSKPRQSKYRNVKTKYDGITFDSKKECERYQVLKQWQQKGLIKNLVLQPKFLIAESVQLGGKKQRARYYIADFMYQDQDGNQVVEDVKGMKTDIYKLKRHLVKAIHGIEIKEVY